MSNSTSIPIEYTTAEKNALIDVKNGSIILDTDINQLQTTYDFGATWQNLSTGDSARGSMTIVGNEIPGGTPTVIVTPGAPVKIEGPYQSNSLVNFTHLNGELTYTGSNPATFKITVDVSAEMELDSDTIAVYIYRDTTQIAISEQRTFVGPTSPVPQNVGTQALVDMNPGEKISIFIANLTDADNITISNLTCIVQASSSLSAAPPPSQEKFYGGWTRSVSGVPTPNPGIDVYQQIVMASYPSLPSNGFSNLSGLVTYANSETLNFRVSYDISLAITSGTGTNANYRFSLQKNGIDIDVTKFGIFVGVETRYQSIGESMIIELEQSDTLRIAALNNSSSSSTITCYSAGIVITQAD